MRLVLTRRALTDPSPSMTHADHAVTVYDPFVGGGTTLAVAMRLARQRLAEAA